MMGVARAGEADAATELVPKQATFALLRHARPDADGKPVA